jgi:hypothetical protein
MYSIINESVVSSTLFILGLFFIGFYCLVMYSLAIHGKFFFKRVSYFQVNEVVLIFFCVNVFVPLLLFSWIYSSRNTYSNFFSYWLYRLCSHIYFDERKKVNYYL